MSECIVNRENLAESSNQFHFNPEKAPTFKLPGGVEVVLYKAEDPEIPLHPDSMCAIENILTKGVPDRLMYLNYPCFKCATRIFMQPAKNSPKPD